jgi:uncharacterized metal-binding protein YceD (DUF177 family)
MKPPVPEFSRLIEIDRIPASGSTEKLKADAKECADLARRLGLPAIHAFSAVLKVEHWRKGGAKVSGQLIADVDQTCVVTLEDFRSIVAKPVSGIFLTAKDMPKYDDDSDEADADLIEDGKADLGELVAETLALELDPYPRKPGAAFQPHIEEDEKANPFGALSQLKGGQ